MKTSYCTPLAAFILTLALTPSVPWADEGHDHGHDAAPPPVAPASPRFAVASKNFEVVGVVDGEALTLYLDRADTNTPVEGAQLEVEIGGRKVPVEPHEEGEFHGTLGQAARAGVVPVAVMVTAGRQTDRLAGELEIHGEAHASEHAHTGKAFVAWTAGVALTLVALLLLAHKRFPRRARPGGTA